MRSCLCKLRMNTGAVFLPTAVFDQSWRTLGRLIARLAISASHLHDDRGRVRGRVFDERARLCTFLLLLLGLYGGA